MRTTSRVEFTSLNFFGKQHIKVFCSYLQCRRQLRLLREQNLELQRQLVHHCIVVFFCQNIVLLNISLSQFSCFLYHLRSYPSAIVVSFLKRMKQFEKSDLMNNRDTRRYYIMSELIMKLSKSNFQENSLANILTMKRTENLTTSNCLMTNKRSK